MPEFLEVDGFHSLPVQDPFKPQNGSVERPERGPVPFRRYKDLVMGLHMKLLAHFFWNGHLTLRSHCRECGSHGFFTSSYKKSTRFLTCRQSPFLNAKCKVRRLSAFLTLQALTLTQALPASVWADPGRFSKEQALRSQPPAESAAAAGLEESLAENPGAGSQRLSVADRAAVKDAAARYFGAGADREDEIALENFLAQREERIHEFVRLIEADRRGAGLLGRGERLGACTLPPIDLKEIPGPGQRSGSGGLAIDIPSDRAYYEQERLHLMAKLAIQRALGKRVVVNVGIGFVGTAVSTATAAEGRSAYGKIPAAVKKKLKFRGPLEGDSDAYFVIAYQRPSPGSAYKVPAVNRGLAPIPSRDPAVGEKIRETTAKGSLTATYLQGAIAVADTVMLETELHIAKVLPTHLEHSKIEDEATLKLIRQVGQLMQPKALVIVESTIAPGFTRNRLLPAINEELQRRGLLQPGRNANLAHAFQRLEPGVRWYRSLLEQERVGAGVTAEANRLLEEYFTTVGFRYRIFSRVEAVEFMKTLENAWRFGLYELMNSFSRAAEIMGVDSYQVAALIAGARPDTHGLIKDIASIQVGGYCVPKELVQQIKALLDYYGVQMGEVMEIFDTRLTAAMVSDFRGRLAAVRAAEALARQGRRLDDARLHVFGIAFNEGISDTRMSGVERAAREFAHWGMRPSNISLTDPYAKEWPELQEQELNSPECWGQGLRNQQGLSGLRVDHTGDPYSTLHPEADVILMGTRHPQYRGKDRLRQLEEQMASPSDIQGKPKSARQREKDRDALRRLEGIEGLDPLKVAARMMGREGKVIIDTFDFFSDEDYKVFLALGWKVQAYGKGHVQQLDRDLIQTLETELTLEERIHAVKGLLRELRALRGPWLGLVSQELQLAIEKAQAKLRALRQTGKKEGPVRQAQYEKAAGHQERFYAERELAEALHWFDDDDPRVQRLRAEVERTGDCCALADFREQLSHRQAQGRRPGGLPGRISEAERAVSALDSTRQRNVAEYMENTALRPALRTAAAMIKKTNFLHGVPAQHFMTKRPLTGPEAGELDEAVRGPVQRQEFLLLARYLDQAFHMLDYVLLESFTPQEMERMLVEIRHREEALHPERKLLTASRKLRYAVFGDDGKVKRREWVSVTAVRPFRWRTDLETGELIVETDGRNWMTHVVKQLPDLLKRDVPKHWGRNFVLVKPKLVPVEGAQMRAYPPSFDDLPPEFSLWLVRDVLGKGYDLTTLDSEGAVEQDKILFVMMVDPYGAGSGRAGFPVWADSLQPVVSITREGYEVPMSVKGIGVFVGGDRRFAHTTVETLGVTTGRRVSGGMTATGAIGQSTLAQVPGFVTGVGSEHGLTLMSTSDGYLNGLAPRLSFGMDYEFTHGIPGPGGAKTRYFSSGRIEFDTGRLGHYPWDEEFDHEERTREAARILGWNAAELLAHLPVPMIHIALTLDNTQANGYFTDPDSIVPPLYRERNPYGALFKYFGYSMQNTIWDWLSMKASKEGNPIPVADEHLALLRPWLRGFISHLLASGKVRRAPFEKFNRFSRLSDSDFLKEVRREYGKETNQENFNALARELIDTLWRHYVAYEVLKNRLQYGFSQTVESTYTGTAGDRFSPGSLERTEKYLADQRELLRIAKGNIRDGLYREGFQGAIYPELPFDFEAALSELDAKSASLKQMARSGATDFSAVYPLSFYPAEVAQSVAVLDLDAVREGSRPLHIAGEIPLSAPLVEKQVVTAQAKPADESNAGLEEVQTTFTLEELSRVEADPVGTGLRAVVEKLVPAPYVEKELKKARELIREGLRKKMFLPDRPIALVRTTGRARIFMGHPDLMGIGAFSIDAATHQSIWMLVQMTDDGKVIADNLDPQYGRLKPFGIQDNDVLPENAQEIAEARPQWLEWAQSHTFENRWEGLVKGTLAVIRTKMLDPTGERRNDLSRKGFRILLSNSDIPSGKGFSASSSIPAGMGPALNALWEGRNLRLLTLSPQDLQKLDYAAYVVDDLAGVADITAILEGELGQATVLWYDPDRVGQKLLFPDNFRVFAFDSNVLRLNHTSYPPEMRNYGKHIQTLTNISVPLAILWFRMLARTHPGELDFLEEILTAHWPSGVVRELTEAPDAAIKRPKYADKIVSTGEAPARGRGAEQKRRRFVEQIMARVPNEWTLGQIVAALREGLPSEFYPQIDNLSKELVPLGAHGVDASTAQGQRRLRQMRGESVIPMRQMAMYGINEIDRGLKYIDAAQRGDTQTLLRLMREAHDGDRALCDPAQPYLAGTPVRTAWGLSNPEEGFQRSLIQIDELVDRFEETVDAKVRRKSTAAARVSGAGLGGLVMGAVDTSKAKGAFDTAVRWLRSRRPPHEVIEIAPSAGARVIRLPKNAAKAGLEELTSDRLDALVFEGQSVRSLVGKVPAALDPWLDKPVRVALWVADFDHTLNVPSTGPLVQPMRTLLADSVIDQGALLWVNSGSAVGDASTNMEERFLVPIEQEFRDRSAQGNLQSVKFMGAVGQQLVSYDSAGVRRMQGIPAGPAFTPEQQVETLKRWLTLFVDEYPAGTDQEAWKARIQENNNPTAFRQIALELAKAWNISRLDIALRGVDPATGVLSSDRPGMITLMLPKDGSLAGMAQRMAQVFDSELRSSMPAGLKPTIPGAAFVTVLFYAKEDQILDEYQRVASQLPSDNGIVVTLGDNPGSDTFFNLTSNQFGRPVLHFLVDSNFAASRPDLLVPDQKFVEGSQQVIEAFVDAQKRARSYREVSFLPGQFSIRDLEQATGYSWEQLRAAAKAGLEEGFEPVGLDYRTTQEVVLSGSGERSVIRLPNGAGIAAEGGGAEVRLASGVLLEQNVRIVAPQGKKIAIGAGTQVLTGTQLVGQIRIGRNVVLDAVVTGDTLIGDGTTFSCGSRTTVNNSVLMPVTVRAQGSGQVVEKSVPVKVTQAATINESIVWGSRVFQGAKVLNSILGPSALMGNDAMISRTVLYGLSPDSRTSAAHHNDLTSMIALPLTERRDLSRRKEQRKLEQEMLALRLGVLESRVVDAVIPDDKHPSRPQERWTLRLGDTRVTLAGRADNLGAGATTSNFDPRNDGSKAHTILWGGVWAGVGSIFSAPVEVGPRSGISNNAVVSGQKALVPGTLVLPQGAAAEAFKPGYLDESRGRLGRGVEQNMEIRIQAVRLLEVLCRVAAQGAAQEVGEQQKEAYRKELGLLKTYLAEAVADLQRYLSIVKVSVSNLQADSGTAPGDADAGKRLEEQRRVLKKRGYYGRVVREATATVSSLSGLEEHSMGNAVEFLRPEQVIPLHPAAPGYGDAVGRGHRRIREHGVLFLIFAAGRASRFADSVRDLSPEYYDEAKARGCLDDENGASKLVAPLGVSGLGPVIRQLEALSDLGARAGERVDVVVVDSAGNREMLQRAIEQAGARIDWNRLNLFPGRAPVDQGEGLQVLTMEGQPLFEYNPATGRMDKPVMSPSGEFGAFLAGLKAVQQAGVSLSGRDVFPMYGDQAVLYSDPDLLGAVVGNLENSDITGVAIGHRRVGDRWVPDGGVLSRVRWADGAEALAIAERDVRNPQSAPGIYSPLLDRSELATEGHFPYNAAPPIFGAEFVGVLLEGGVSMREQVKAVKIRTGPGPADTETVQARKREMELTEAMQIGTQQGKRAQVLQMENERRQALKGFSDVLPANQEIFRQGREFLRSRLGSRVSGDLGFVEVSPRFRGFQVEAEGRLQIEGNVGVVVDHRGIWVHRYEGKNREDLARFSGEGRLLLAANPDGTVTLSKPVEIAPAVYDQLPPYAGLEEFPEAADPLSPRYAPARFEVSSPIAYSDDPAVSPVFEMDSFDPSAFVRAVQEGKRVRVRTNRARFGEDLWAKQANRGELQGLYRLGYDIADTGRLLTGAEISRVVALLNHENQAVAAAARDAILQARLHGSRETLEGLAHAFQGQASEAIGPYARHYFIDAFTTRIDPVNKLEWGSPETPVFAGPMTDERKAHIQQQLLTLVTPGNKLAMLTGSGQRMGATIGEVEAGLTLTDRGRPAGFPSDQILVDPGAQPHDAVKVLFGLVAQLFAENMARWREDPKLGGKPGDMPKEWKVGIGMDPRASGAAIFQVAARVFRQMGIEVEFCGICSAPEAAARALLSDPGEHMLAFFEITPSHIPVGNEGTKLMLWLGQILPWEYAEEFNRQIVTAAADPERVSRVIDWLGDSSMNGEVQKILEGLPEGYRNSRRIYHEYLRRLFTGEFEEGPAAQAALAGKWRSLGEGLRRQGVVPVFDLNGGARIPDQPLFAEITPGMVVISPRAADFAHALPPNEVSARLLVGFAEKTAPAFEAAGLTPVYVGPDPDGDRKSIILRNPQTGKFEYLDPQAGYMLDVLYHVAVCREVGIPGVGVVGNGPTTVVAQVLARRLGYEFRTAEVGEANVVRQINLLQAELETRYGKGKAAVIGGEGSAAATILGKVQVRDMAQAFASAFGFFQSRERVRRLIETLVDDPAEKARLLSEVDRWYKPDQLQYLLWRIVHEILPPMLNADPNYKTETHLGVGLGPGDRQKYFKDAADELLAPDGEWIRRIREETARQISAAASEAISPDQIIVSPPFNNVEAYQVPGAGNRAVPDRSGRVIQDGGYEIHVSYVPGKAAKQGIPGKEYYLYKLWLRGSKTEVGVMRRLFLGTCEFLPRDQAPRFLENLLLGVYPIWVNFVGAVEAEELKGHVEGRFPLFPAETHAARLNYLASNLDGLRDTAPEIRAINLDRFGKSGAPDYNETDARNLRWQDQWAAEAVRALQIASLSARRALEPVRGLVDEIRQSRVITLEQGARLTAAVSAVRESMPSPKGTLAEELVRDAYRWKMERMLAGLSVTLGREIDAPAEVDGILQRMERLEQVADEMERLTGSGIVQANLVADSIILAKEADFAMAAGLEEAIELPAGATEGRVVFLTPDVLTPGMIAGLEELRPALGEQLRLVAFARDAAQKGQVEAGLEEAGLSLLEPVIDVQAQYKGNLQEAVVDRQVAYWSDNLEVQVFFTLAGLEELGRFLRIPAASFRAWQERVTGSELGVQA